MQKKPEPDVLNNETRKKRNEMETRNMIRYWSGKYRIFMMQLNYQKPMKERSTDINIEKIMHDLTMCDIKDNLKLKQKVYWFMTQMHEKFNTVYGPLIVYLPNIENGWCEINNKEKLDLFLQKTEDFLIEIYKYIE